ncbi:MAG: sugar phosphate isomerase/epimerase [Planctomycetes bacterium]|nr:sugar phosphate isomerase/epimerase [Planctomycetota bacterium]
MKLIFFTKAFPELGIDGWIDLAQRSGMEGLDLCCRPGYPIHPGNVERALPAAVAGIESAGLVLPMVTAPGDLVQPGDPRSHPILAGMQAAGVRLLKLGYFHVDNAREDYWVKVGEVRRALEGWAMLARDFGVKVCYHNHSGASSMGINAAALMHFVHGLDPESVGVYLDPGHLLLDGEHPDIAFNMVKGYLAIVGLKDAAKERNPVGDGWRYSFPRAGHGDVPWNAVFDHLVRLGFHGPLSVHAEYDRHYAHTKPGHPPGYLESLAEEVGFFRQRRADALQRAVMKQGPAKPQ